MAEVTSVKQSPMNPLRWNLELDCGHEAWITSKRKPARKEHPCVQCVVDCTGKQQRDIHHAEGK